MTQVYEVRLGLGGHCTDASPIHFSSLLSGPGSFECFSTREARSGTTGSMQAASPLRSSNSDSERHPINRQRQFARFELSLERRVVTRACFASSVIVRGWVLASSHGTCPACLHLAGPLLVLRRPRAVQGTWTFNWKPRLLSAWLLHGRHARHLRGPLLCAGVGPDESDSEFVFPRRGESASRRCLRRFRSGCQAAVHGWPWPPNPCRFRE